MSLLETEPPCGRCGEPAKGYAKIGDVRYCHEGQDPTCYMLAGQESYLGTEPGWVGPVEVFEQRYEGDEA